MMIYVSLAHFSLCLAAGRVCVCVCVCVCVYTTHLQLSGCQCSETQQTLQTKALTGRLQAPRVSKAPHMTSCAAETCFWTVLYTVQKYRGVSFINVFERRRLRSSRLHLLEQKSSKNSNNVIYYYNLKKCFLCEYLLKCNSFLWSKLNFQHHYSSLVFGVTCSFRNHSDMLIYYQC